MPRNVVLSMPAERERVYFAPYSIQHRAEHDGVSYYDLDKLDYKVDLEAGWDIGFGEGRETSGNELPMHFDISMDGTFLVNQDGKVWKSGGSFFRSSIWA